VSVCRGCGKSIDWGVTPEGKKIPLDPSAPVYVITERSSRPDGSWGVQRTQDAMVSHFITCPDANRFSGSKRKVDARPA